MKKKFTVLVLWMLFLMSGCTSENVDRSMEINGLDNMASDLSDRESEISADTMKDSEQPAVEYSEIYREAFEDGTLAQLDTIRGIPVHEPFPDRLG